MLWKCVQKEIRHPANAFRVKKKNTTLVTIFLIEKNYTYIYLHNAGAGTTATHTSVKNTEKKKIIARSTM